MRLGTLPTLHYNTPSATHVRRKTLRVALLSMLEPAAEGSTLPRAFLRIGGMTLARQQLGLALALGCERIICIARALTPELVEVQHAAERAGARFHLVPGPRGVVGLVTAADDVIVLGDGLFASTAAAAGLLEQGPGVLVQPIETGLAAGFERVDINHAGAAALRLPGRLIERLAELPHDCDAVSALQRIALQAGVPQRAVPQPAGNGSFWTLVRSEAEAHALEPQWIRQRTAADQPLSLGRLIGHSLVRSLGPALLHAGSGPGAIAIGALALGLLALGAGWLGYPAVGLALAGLAWITQDSAATLSRIESDGAIAPAAESPWQLGFGWLLDAAIVVLAGWGSALRPGQEDFERLFPAVIFVALLRLVPKALARRWTAWLEDRAVICAALVVAVASGYGSAALQLGAIGLALAGILVPRGHSRLTPP